MLERHESVKEQIIRINEERNNVLTEKCTIIKKVSESSQSISKINDEFNNELKKSELPANFDKLLEIQTKKLDMYSKVFNFELGH